MKNLLTILFCVLSLLLAASASLVSGINGRAQLGWGYNRDVASTNLSFNIYWTTNLLQPAGAWPLFTNVSSVAALNTNDARGTNYQIALDLAPAQYFFVAVASNFWGESSLTSNLVSTPIPPQPVNTLQLQKLP